MGRIGFTAILTYSAGIENCSVKYNSSACSAAAFLPRHLMSYGSSLRLASQLARACDKGDLPSAKAAVADGASVNEKGEVPGWSEPVTPLVAAVASLRRDVVVWLLSCGADPNADDVIYYGVRYSTPAIVQLLIDTGGDVNRESREELPLFTAIDCCSRTAESRDGDGEGKVRTLLAQPSLDVAITRLGDGPVEYAQGHGTRAVAALIAQEVRDG